MSDRTGAGFVQVHRNVGQSGDVGEVAVEAVTGLLSFEPPARRFGPTAATPDAMTQLGLQSNVTETAAPAPAAEVAAVPTEPTLQQRDGRLYATDGAAFPERCAVCGDNVELASFRTFPGGVRYHVCHEHVIAAASKLVVGAAMMLVAGYQLAAPLLDGRLPGKAVIVGFGAILVGGVAMAVLAIPVHAGRCHGGWRRIRGGSKALRGQELQ